MLPPQPVRPAFVVPTPGPPKKPADGGLSRACRESPPSRLAFWAGKIADCLRPTPRMFPFSGDCGRRLGSIATAARGRQYAVCTGQRIRPTRADFPLPRPLATASRTILRRSNLTARLAF
jgi:hypothetical protein